MQPDGVYTHNPKCIRDFPTNNFCHDHQPQNINYTGSETASFSTQSPHPNGENTTIIPFQAGKHINLTEKQVPKDKN